VPHGGGYPGLQRCVRAACACRGAGRPLGAAARAALALDKLRRRFEAADAPGFGSLSRTQARRAGLGFIDTHFERIDATRSGHVSFEELRRYLNSAR
jgi:hypothetical protein